MPNEFETYLALGFIGLCIGYVIWDVLSDWKGKR